MEQEIIVDIAPDGNVKIEAKGFKGRTCSKATQGLRDALGVTEVFQAKPEYNQVELEANQQKLKQF